MKTGELKKKKINFLNNILIIALVWFIFLIVRIILFKSINFFINPYLESLFYDEGTYLYMAKMISQGWIPFKNLFIGHMPFYPYLLAFCWKLGLNFKTIHYLHIFLTSLVVFPLFLLSQKFLKKQVFFPLPLLLIGFSFFYLINSLLVILDPIMTIFITWGLYFYFSSQPSKKFWAGLFFALATLIKLTALISLFSLLLADFIFNKDKKRFFRQTLARFLQGYLILIIPIFIWLFSLPRFWQNTFFFHLNQHLAMTGLKKIETWIETISLDPLLALLAPLISLIFIFNLDKFSPLFKKNNQTFFKNLKITKVLSLYLIIGYFISLFSFKTFYPHHLLQFFPGFSLILSIFISLLISLLTFSSQKNFLKISLIVFIVISLFSLLPIFIWKKFTFQPRKKEEIETKKIIKILKSKKGYLYTASLDYAFLGEREITPWYYSAVPNAARDFKIPYSKYNQIVQRSKTIIMDKRLRGYLPWQTIAFIYQNFNIVYQNSHLKIFEKRNNDNKK